MIAPPRTLVQIRYLGLAALSRELGAIGMMRFLQQFEVGQGDYSAERHQWLDTLSLDQAIQQIEALRLASSANDSTT